MKINPRIKLDGGEMAVGLVLKKGTDERRIFIVFNLKTGKKGRVKFILSLSSKGKVLWQKERTEELEVKNNHGSTGGRIHDVLPSNLPSNVLVVIEIIEWEPS